MSDPAANVGIEDVLASVRRLVSSERRVRTDSAIDPVSGPAETPKNPVEALVLTADFRVGSGAVTTEAADLPPASEARQTAPDMPLDDDNVADDNGADDTVATWPEDDSAPEMPVENIIETIDDVTDEPRLLTLEERIAQLEAAVQAHAATEFEPDGSEDLTQHRPISIPGLIGPEDAADAGSDLTARFLDTDADEIDDPQAEDRALKSVLETAVNKALAEAVAALEDDASALDDAPGSIVTPSPDAGLAADPAEDLAADDLPDDALTDDLPGHDLPETDLPATDLPATHAAAIDAAYFASGRSDTGDLPASETPNAAPEPEDTAEADSIDFDAWENIYGAAPASEPVRPEAGNSPNRVFHPKPSLVHPDPDPQPEDHAPEDNAFDDRLYQAEAEEDEIAGFDFVGDSQEIDEETLRDLVAEIVREELQGALGERITRNVRKLVRREIMRALSIRDFE